MANSLTILDRQAPTALADYIFAQARTQGTWHIVRKSYGDNRQTYNFAQFTNSAAAYAAWGNVEQVQVWTLEPPSNIDFTLVQFTLVAPFSPSTATAGVLAASSGGGGGDSTPVVAALGQTNNTLGQMLSLQTAPTTPRATEATLAAVLQQLVGTLRITSAGVLPVSLPVGFSTAQGQVDTITQLTALNTKLAGTLAVTAPTVQQVTGTFFQATQPISASSLPLPANAATAAQQTAILNAFAPLSTAALQNIGNGLLSDIKLAIATPSIAAGAATSAAQLIGNTSLNTLVSTTATAVKQDAQQVALDAIKASTAAGASLTQQTAGNALLQLISTNTTPSASLAYSLVSLAGNNATLVRTGATWLLGGTVTNSASAIRFFMLYNLAAAPTAGAVPFRTIAIPPNATVTISVPMGRYIACTNGLAIAAGTLSILGTLSTVAAVLGTSTGLTAGDLIINIDYAY